MSKTDEILDKIADISSDTSTEIILCSFDEWVEMQTNGLSAEEKDDIADKWLMAVVETFALKRSDFAPIEEPSDKWLMDISKLLIE